MPAITVCLSFDFDTMSANIFRGQTTPTWLSRGEFGARVGIERVLALLSAHHLRASFFIPGYTADSFPDRVREIPGEGMRSATTAICMSRPRRPVVTRRSSEPSC